MFVSQITHRNQLVRILIGVNDGGHANLSQIIQTLGALASFLRGSQRRQQHCRQNADDGDDHQQFDERETQ